MSCVLGFDVGSKLIGVAIGNTITASARALAVIPVRDNGPDWAQLDTLHKQWQPDTLVVGLPLALDGTVQPATRLARRFAEHLRERYQAPVALVDEQHSSQEAAQRFAQARAAGTKRRSDAATIDAEAAAVILERWLAVASASH
ncbi:Holliday junction resolvase RuvX [Frateuria sp. GZRe12]|uniref:Holliday junction resolvase RuvX n=1 Tax=Frateuria sp. GZRe12 TaxID=3351533 RepID=UPI003EDBC127